MIILARLLLALATLLTLLVAQLVADAHPVGGADAMGLIVVLAVLLVQWVVLAGAALIAAARGAFPWMHPSRAIQAVAAGAWTSAVGLTASSAVVLAYGPDSAAIVPWAVALAIVVPGLLIAGTAVALAGDAGGAWRWRLATGLLTLCAAAGALQMFRLERAADAVASAAAAVAEQERQQWDAARQAAFAALSPTAPLRDWLPWLDVSGELGTRALAAVRARPTLEQEVTAMLRSEEAPEALRFMWLWMPERSSALAGPARDAIATLPEWAERWLATPPPPPESPVDSPDPLPSARPIDLSDMAQAAIVIASCCDATGLDFETPITAFLRVLERHALPEERLGEDRTYQSRSFLRGWLERRAEQRNGRD